MKSKVMIASLLLAGTCLTVNAQEKKCEKKPSNIFMGVGVGGMAVINDGMNTPTLNFNISLGKYITPVWGVRGQIGGFWQSLDDQDNGYHQYCKKFGELNLDAMLNLTNLFGKYNPDRALDVYLFGGPTMNIGKAVDTELTIKADGTQVSEYTEDGTKARFGATVGLGLAYNISQKWAINLEGRVGVAPSLFGDASDCRKAEATARLNLGFAYTFGGKRFGCCKKAQAIDNDEINKARAEVAQLQKELAAAKNAPAQVKEVVKEVVKEKTTANPMAIFFKIGSAQIDDYGMVNIRLIAKAMKADSSKTYKIAGYCDKATGSSNSNQVLSEKRAKAVYDALVAEGVSANQLELVGFGGTANMFGKDYLNRVVIME